MQVSQACLQACNRQDSDLASLCLLSEPLAALHMGGREVPHSLRKSAATNSVAVPSRAHHIVHRFAETPQCLLHMPQLLPTFRIFKMLFYSTQGKLDQSRNHCDIMLTTNPFWHQAASHFWAGGFGHRPFSACSCWVLCLLKQLQVGILRDATSIVCCRKAERMVSHHWIPLHAGFAGDVTPTHACLRQGLILRQKIFTEGHQFSQRTQ